MACGLYLLCQSLHSYIILLECLLISPDVVLESSTRLSNIRYMSLVSNLR